MDMMAYDRMRRRNAFQSKLITGGILGVIVLCIVGFWGSIGFVVFHFVSKFW